MTLADPLLYDTIFMVILVISIFLAFSKGFTRELFSLLEWLLAIMVSWFFYDALARKLSQYLTLPSSVLYLVSVTLLFVTSFIAIHIAARFLLGVLHTNVPPKLDRLLGAFFGTLRGILIPCLLFNIMMMLSVSPMIPRALARSYSYPLVRFVTYQLSDQYPEDLMRKSNQHVSDWIDA